MSTTNGALQVVAPNVYTGLRKSDRAFLQRKAARIKARTARIARDLYEDGRDLLAAKEVCPHGQWGQWLAEEFEWDERTAQRLMKIAVRASQIRHRVGFKKLGPTILHRLCADAAPEEALEEAVDRAEAGEVITPKEAERIVERRQDAAGLDEALEGLSPAKQAEVRRLAIKEGRRDRLERIESHLNGARKLMVGEQDIPDRALEHLDACLEECRHALA